MSEERSLNENEHGMDRIIYESTSGNAADVRGLGKLDV